MVSTPPNSLVALSLDSLVRYGKANHALPRKVITRGIMHEKSLELHPPRLKVFRLTDRVTDVRSLPMHVQASSADAVKQTLVALVNAIRSESEPPDTVHRVWKLREPSDSDGSLYPASKILANATLFPESDKSLSEALVESDDIFVVEFQENGKWIVDEDEATVHSQAPIFNQNGDFFSKMMTNTLSKIIPNGPTTTFANSFSRSLSPAAGRAKFVEPGTLGLGNMSVLAIFPSSRVFDVFLGAIPVL